MTDNSVLYDDLETFKENFSLAIKEENFEVQIDMTKKLGLLAEHLGVEITRRELLPFIKENIDCHDEILLNLSEQLKNFIPLVGGYEHSQPVLDLLRKICNTDENVVREKTIGSLKSIAEDLNSDLTEELLVPVLDALASENWFTSKCSAIALFPIIYPKVKEEKKEELRHNFRILAQDESPIVRKAAAICLIELIPMIDKESLKNEFISVFDNIANDKMDCVQVHAVKIAISLCKRLTESEVEEFIFKTLEVFANSTSWKLRQVLASNIAEIQEVIQSPKLRGKILAMFQKVLKDTEEEVRIVACKNLVGYCRYLKSSYDKQSIENNFIPVFLQSIVPQIALLVVDASVDVKLALTRNILSLSTVLNKELFMEHIMPMVVDILEEEASVPVKAGILENLNDLPSDIDFAQSLPSIKKVVRTLIVYSQSHWRTRKGLLIAFMHIAKFASKEYFSENLKIFYASLLGDPVFAVRRTAPIILPLLAQQYGMTWTTNQIIPYFKMFAKDDRYLYRYVPIFGINELINPSVICGDEVNYLKNLKDIQTPISAKVLYKLKILLKTLSKKLEEKNFKDIFSLSKSIDDFKTDNIILYAGETVQQLKPYGDEIFNCNIENIDKSNEWYLTGLISLIYKDFLDLLLFLFEDRIVNVQIRSIYTLNKIKNFADDLSKEIKEKWVNECIETLSKEERSVIEKEVELELKEKTVEIIEEKLDTTLMENIFTSSSSSLNVKNDENIPEINIEYADDAKIESKMEVSEANDIKVTDTNGEESEDKDSEMERIEVSETLEKDNSLQEEKEHSASDIEKTEESVKIGNGEDTFDSEVKD